MVLALLAQVATVGLILAVANLTPGVPARQESRPVSLAQLSAAEWERNRTPARRADPSRAVPPREEEPEPERDVQKKPPGQVVAAAPGNDERPEDAKFAAESNNRVEKETRAKKTDRLYRNPGAQWSARERSNDQGIAETKRDRPGTSERETDQSLQQGTGARSATELPSVAAREEIAIQDRGAFDTGPSVANRRGSDPIRGNSDRLSIGTDGEQLRDKAGTGAPKGAAGKPLILTPSANVLSSLRGSPAPDHLEDVEEGDGTFLNTREWKYAGFMNRVKQSVVRHWDPVSTWVIRDPTGEIYGNRDRATGVHVTLDANGVLEAVKVQHSSGVDFFDEAAVAAFRDAQPFPNPPGGMLDEDGKVRFTFGFYVGMDHRPRVRIQLQRGY